MRLDLNKLKLAQARQCLSIDEITKITGLGRITISKTFNGRVSPSPKTIGLIARALSVDVSELLLEEE